MNNTEQIQRLLSEIGYNDILEALWRAKEMRAALIVIYTWAGNDGEYLDHKHVRKIAGKALHTKEN